MITITIDAFFIAREDGTKEDFSVHKCIERLGNENKKGKKD